MKTQATPRFFRFQIELFSFGFFIIGVICAVAAPREIEAEEGTPIIRLPGEELSVGLSVPERSALASSKTREADAPSTENPIPPLRDLAPFLFKPSATSGTADSTSPLPMRPARRYSYPVSSVHRKPARVQPYNKRGRISEGWYFYWGVGVSANAYPDRLQHFVKKRDGGNGFSMDGVGMYLPFHDSKTLFGIIWSYAHESINAQMPDNSTEDVFITQWEWSMSFMRWMGVEAGGSGFFWRVDLGTAGLYSDYLRTDSMGDVIEQDIHGGGFCWLVGIGMSVPVSSRESSWIFLLSMRTREIDSEYDDFDGTYRSVSLSLAGLW